ncbi:MAG: hypothetical protein HQK89_04750 [Nitrospirae bacterium]|nr:hypothetical protein [Nitrospirota bacterium]
MDEPTDSADSPIVNISALEPLYLPHEKPAKHRVMAKEVVNEINAFRNTYIAHVEKELTDVEKAKKGLISWVVGLYRIYTAHKNT